MIKEINIKQFDKKFDWVYSIWTSVDYKETLRNNLERKYKTWSKMEINGCNYLIPGVYDNSNMLYFTKELIDYNVIVKL